MERARFLLKNGRREKLEALCESLKEAPIRVRRLGLLMSVAMWSCKNDEGINELLGKWLFDEWKMLERSGGAPTTAEAFIERLQEIDARSPLIRSAMEIEAEAFLQAAKVLASALTGRS